MSSDEAEYRRANTAPEETDRDTRGSSRAGRPTHCPFCGIHLPNTADPLDEHLEEHGPCASEFKMWMNDRVAAKKREEQGIAGNLMWGIIAVIVMYSVVTEQLLLGLIAASVTFTAFQVVFRLERGDSRVG